MLFVISPAKKLDLSEETRFTQNYSQPAHLDASKELVAQLAGMSEETLGELMGISPQLATLNHERFQQFSLPFGPENAKQALLCFHGDVYQQFQLEAYGEAEFAYAQAHLRILSGLYGLLRPLDLIQPYRLEMGTRLANARGKDLYAFWGDRLTRALAAELAALDQPALINLASHEYFKSLQARDLGAPVITPVFKDYRNGQLKSIFLYAKQARGAMCDFAIREQLRQPEDLKAFTGMGYRFEAERSTDTEWLFTRES